MIFVDGVDIGDPTDVALRDRRMLSADGIFIVVATISEQDGSSVAEPEVIFRGVPFPTRPSELLDDIREHRRGVARPRGRGGDPRDRPPAEDPPRRPRRVRLRPPAPAADGPAGRRRGLSGGAPRAARGSRVSGPCTRLASSAARRSQSRSTEPTRRRGRVLPGFVAADRIGIVVRRPCGAVGASALLLGRGHRVLRRPARARRGLLHLSRLLRVPRRPPPGEPQPSRHLAAAQGGRRRRRARGGAARDQRPRDHPPRRRGRRAGRRLVRPRDARERAGADRVRDRLRANGRTRDADVAIAAERRHRDLRRRRARAVARRPAGERDRIAAARRALLEDGRPGRDLPPRRARRGARAPRPAARSAGSSLSEPPVSRRAGVSRITRTDNRRLGRHDARSSGADRPAGSASAASGRWTTKRAPASASSRSTRPPCDSATARTIDRPRPDELAAVALAADEALEDLLAQLLGHAGAVVLDDEHDLVRRAAPTPAWTRVPGGVWRDRVLHEVQRHPVQLVARAVDDRGPRVDRQLVAVGERAELGGGVDERPAPTSVAAAAAARLASARARSRRSPTRRRIRCEERSADSRRLAPLAVEHLGEQLEVREDARQRRAQLVRGVGDELALARERVLGLGPRGLEAVEHLLQRAPELGDLVVGARARERRAGVAGLGDVARAPAVSAAIGAIARRPTTARRGARAACRRARRRRGTAARADGRLDDRERTPVLDDDAATNALRVADRHAAHARLDAVAAGLGGAAEGIAEVRARAGRASSSRPSRVSTRMTAPVDAGVEVESRAVELGVAVVVDVEAEAVAEVVDRAPRPGC